jgi:hypothetical protein
LKKEAWAKTIRNQLIAHKRRDKNNKFIAIKQMSQIFRPDPEIVRKMGEELKNVLAKIATFYMSETWFPEMKSLVTKESYSTTK